MDTSTFIGQVGSFEVVTRKMNLTAQAGVVLLRDFVGKFAFSDLIDASINVKERERGYPESENILALCWNLILGGSSLRDLDVLRGDGGICQLLGVGSILAPTTAGEFLRSFDIGDITRLQTFLRAAATRVRPHQASETVTIDLDPSLYKQCSTSKQGSSMNYKGQIGYYPIFAFRAETQEILFSHLLAGNRRAVSKVGWVMKQVMKNVPAGNQVYLRADSEFYQWELMNWCEDEGIIYAITADKSRQLVEKIKQLPTKRWKKFGDATQVAELEYAPSGQVEHRYIVKRQREKDKKTGKLKWAYHVIITNDDKREARKLLKWFYKKCAMENLIKQHKNEFGLEKMPSQKYHANWAWLLVGQLAWNLIAWFKRQCLPPETHSQTVRTIRHRLLKVAAKVVIKGRKQCVELGEDYKFKDMWEFAIGKLAGLKQIRSP
jgi:hypothetical protein